MPKMSQFFPKNETRAGLEGHVAGQFPFKKSDVQKMSLHVLSCSITHRPHEVKHVYSFHYDPTHDSIPG